MNANDKMNIYVLIHYDSDEIFLKVLHYAKITISEKSRRLVSLSPKLLWIIRNHLPISSIAFVFQRGNGCSLAKKLWYLCKASLISSTKTYIELYLLDLSPLVSRKSYDWNFRIQLVCSTPWPPKWTHSVYRRWPSCRCRLPVSWQTLDIFKLRIDQRIQWEEEAMRSIRRNCIPELRDSNKKLFGILQVVGHAWFSNNCLGEFHIHVVGVVSGLYYPADDKARCYFG